MRQRPVPVIGVPAIGVPAIGVPAIEMAGCTYKVHLRGLGLRNPRRRVSYVQPAISMAGRGFAFLAALAIHIPALCAPLPASLHSAKVIAPVEIVTAHLPRRRKDREGEQRLEVKITPRVNAPKLEVAVALPRAVTLVTGELRWQAPAKAGVVQRRELLLKVPRQGEQRVVITARIVAPRALPMSRAVSFVFNPASEVATPRGALREPARVPHIPITPAPRAR